MKKITILHMLDRLDAGGMENGVINIANNIDTEKFECIICIFSKGGILSKRLILPKHQIIKLQYGPGFHFFSIFKLYRMFRRLKIDILHTHGWGARSFVSFLAGKLSRTPKIINGEHGMLHIDTYFQQFAQRLMIQKVDGTLSVSTHLKKRIIKTFKLLNNNITVIPNGVDIEKFNGSYNTEEIKKEFKISGQNFHIGIIGSLKLQKNQIVALRAIKKLKDLSKNVDLLLVGDGPDRQFLETKSKELGIANLVYFLGFREDIPSILSLINTLVSCSIENHEGMSNVILEAMSSGVPVISSRSIGSEELIRDKETGLLFDYNEPNDLAEKILKLSENSKLKENIISNAKQKIINEHALNKMVERYQNYYLSQLNGVF